MSKDLQNFMDVVEFKFKQQDDMRGYINDHLSALLKAQDIIRYVWANCKEIEVSRILRNLDEDCTKVINLIGGKKDE